MTRAGRPERGVTMVELLVCLGVLAIALGSILSIFMAGTRSAARANRRMDASRLAHAVFELADRGVDLGGTLHGRGGGGPGRFNVDSTTAPATEDVFYSHDFPAGYMWPPAHVVYSPIPLVWKCRIHDPPAGTFDLGSMHAVEITVSLDRDEDDRFDAAPVDEEIGRWYAAVADR